MQDTKTLIAQLEADIARSEEVLADLDRAAEAFAELNLPVTPEMVELFEKMEAIGEKLSVQHTELLQFGIRG